MSEITEEVLQELQLEVASFQSGKISCYYNYWEELTSDAYILNIVKNGLALDFLEFPEQKFYNACNLSHEENLILDKEIIKLLEKKIVVQTHHESDEFISNLFTRPKRDGSKRMILNLKKLNEHIDYKHFKMESIQNVLDSIQPNCFMASVDLKDAFYSIPILEKHTKYLKFTHRGKLYKFVGMPQGYGPAMRIFTKVCKVPFSHLRTKGHISVVFVDDSYLQGETYISCTKNIIDTINTLRFLGYTVHVDKSVLTPTQRIIFLGFIFDSVSMTVILTLEKKEKIRDLGLRIRHSSTFTIRQLAQFLGNIVAAFPAVPYGKLHYREMERNKISALKTSKGDFDANMSLSHKSILEIDWWINNIIDSFKYIRSPEVDNILYTDASKKGWGATHNNSSTGGLWDKSECENHINWLELKAIEIGLKTYYKASAKHFKIFCDNTTAIAYINNMGGMQSQICNDLAKNIWSWCQERDLWISAYFVPGKENKVADSNSRNFNENTEWELNQNIFEEIINTFYTPDVDLFASRINKKLDKYVSWRPDPHAMAVDAFSLSWGKEKFYMFPPFSIISKVECKIRQDKASGILIVPDWPSQVWYPRVVKLAQKKMRFSPSEKNLKHPTKTEHPCSNKMAILAILF